MPFHLVIPGLVWPNPSSAPTYSQLPLPGLNTLLRHARCNRYRGQTLQSWLLRSYGLDPATAPLARLRRIGEEKAMIDEGFWLCADPVHLHFTRDRLLLNDASTLAIQPEEASAIVHKLNQQFQNEADIIGFEAATASRWYLRLRSPAMAKFTDLEDVIGRALQSFFPQGEKARRWQQLGSEIQILLHNHPCNAARRERAQAIINGVWLWGGSEEAMAAPKPAIPTNPLLTQHPLARGLARYHAQHSASPSVLLANNALVILDTLHLPALHLDAEAWEKPLLAMEQDWFAPLLAMLRNGSATQLRLSVPDERGCLQFTIRPRDLWKFWQRPRTLAALAPNTSSAVSPDFLPSCFKPS